MVNFRKHIFGLWFAVNCFYLSCIVKGLLDAADAALQDIQEGRAIVEYQVVVRSNHLEDANYFEGANHFEDADHFKDVNHIEK